MNGDPRQRHRPADTFSDERFRVPDAGGQIPSRYDMGNSEQQDLIQRNPEPFFTEILDLSSARDINTNPYILERPGRALVAFGINGNYPTLGTETAATDILVYARVGQNTGEAMGFSPREWACKHNRGFRGDFKKLFLGWPAQSNRIARLVIYHFDELPYPPVGSGGGGGSGITSINGDNTAAQTIVAGTNISSVNTVAGVTTINAATQTYTPPTTQVKLSNCSGKGAVNTAILTYGNSVVNNPGADIQYTSDANAGDSFKILTAGVYAVGMSVGGTSGADLGLSLNATGADLTTALHSLTAAKILMMVSDSASGFVCPVTFVGKFNVNDIIRPHSQPTGNTPANAAYESFWIQRIS